MSAFIVSDATIDALVTYGSAGGTERVFNQHPEPAGQKLVNENYRSCNARYRGEYGNPHIYEYKPYIRPLDPVQVIKLCDCYDYQACETDDYSNTEAAYIIRAIRSKAVSRLPGYDAAHWDLPDDHRSDAVSLSGLA